MTLATLARRVTRLVDWPRSPDSVPHRTIVLSDLDTAWRCPVHVDMHWHGVDNWCFVCEDFTGVPA